MRHGAQARPVVLAVVALLSACVIAPRPGGRKVYAQDSISAHCPHNPALCEVTAKGITDGLPSIVGAAGVGMAASQGAATARVIKGEPLDPATRSQVDRALKECADMARSKVLPRSPTEEDCNKLIITSSGERKTQAMLWGQKMHETAFKCVEQRLSALLPGKFSIEQRYRYNPATKETTVVSADEASQLLSHGWGAELLGTIVPDVVIHNGNPRFPRAVYDFKFPCVNTDAQPWWREYPQGHPFSGSNQGQVYWDALGQSPARVVPRLGVIP